MMMIVTPSDRSVEDAKIVLWTILTAIYEDELVEEPERRETIIENIERNFFIMTMP
jgi:hypothetical protein